MSIWIRLILTVAFLAAFGVGWHYATHNVYVDGLDIDFVWLAHGGLKLAPLGAIFVAIGIMARHPLSALGGIIAIVLGVSSVWLFETTLRPAYLAQREAQQIRYQNHIYIAGATQVIPCPLNWQLLLVADARFGSEVAAQLVLLPNNINQPAVELAKTDFRGRLQELSTYLPPSVRTIRDGCKDEATGDTYKSLLHKY